nr:hypothetical protein [uncultured Pedobacter sp.]
MLKKKWDSVYNKLVIFFSIKDHEQNKYFLTFFRVGIALIALVDVLSMRMDWRLLFSQQATFVPQKLLFIFSEYFGRLNAFYKYLDNNDLVGFFYSYGIWIYIIALAFLLIGFATRFTAILALILQLLIFKSFAEVNYGYDQFLTMSLFYCVIFPVGKYHSVDSFIFKIKVPDHSFYYQRIIQIHLCMVYFFSGIAKALDVSWWTGNELWRAVSSIYNDYFLVTPYILVIVGIGTIILETLYPILVLNKKIRKVTIILIMLMHLSIAVVLKLYSFSAILITWNALAFSKFAKTIPESIDEKNTDRIVPVNLLSRIFSGK